MTEADRELPQKALSLPDHERAELAGSLIASLDTNIDPDVDLAWQQEVVRRLDEVRDGKVTPVPWEQVAQKARSLMDGK